MDLHILDANFRRVGLVDQYTSMIWSERYNEIGDFELTLKASREMRSLLKTDTWFVIPQSHRVMRIDNIEDKATESGTVLEISGQSMEALMEDRVATNGFLGFSTMPAWSVTGLPLDVAKGIFNRFMATPALNVLDNVPFYSSASYLPLGNNAPAHESTKFDFEPDTVLGIIQRLCKLYNLGFRLVRNDSANGMTPSVHFDIYAGSDRTTGQVIYPAVIFDQKLENFGDVTELTSISGAKNVAYVYGNKGVAEVYAEGVLPSVAGFTRKVLFVKADDITLAPGAALDAALIQRGKEELAKHRNILALDGEISQTSSYKYGVDYNLGDIVEVRGSGGLANQMRVTEQIFIADDSGVRSYPTLSLEQVVSPGSWDSVSGNIRWYDTDPSVTWATY